MIETPLN